MSGVDELVTWYRAQLDVTATALATAAMHDSWRTYLLAEVEAKRRILRLYENALSAHRSGSISLRNRTQDEAVVEVLGEAVKELAVAMAGREGYREEWRP